MFFYYLMPIIFLLGILAIAFEDVIKVNKAATAIGMLLLLWVIFLLNAEEFFIANPPKHIQEFLAMFPSLQEMSTLELAYEFIELKLIHGLGDVATTLFFVPGDTFCKGPFP